MRPPVHPIGIIGDLRLMSPKRRCRKGIRWIGATALAGLFLGLAGCQPEGVGTVKAPGPRSGNENLGRPFGNAPEIPKPGKATPAKTHKEVVQPKNDRL